MTYYEFTLPLPTSINRAKTVGGGFRNRQTKKWERQVVRSPEYQEWIEAAGRSWRRQFPNGVAKTFAGRIAVYYVFVWAINDANGIKSDINNREKVLSDYLQGKFYENDNQIDESHAYRNLWGSQNYVLIRVYQIKDSRYTDPRKRFE